MTSSKFHQINLAISVLLAVPLSSGLALAQEPIANVFQKGVNDPAPSIARADLLACAQLEQAQITDGEALKPEAMAEMLNGTWARELTWYGIPVENESAYSFLFDGLKFEAMMYDQSNLGSGEMASAIAEIRSSPKRMSATPTMTFVDCDYAIIDKYYKISDQPMVARDLRVTANSIAEGGLRAVWDQLVDQGFFKREFESEAILRANKGRILNEVTTPSVGGAYWTGSLKPVRIQDIDGTEIDMDGIYVGSHVGAAGEGQRVDFEGTERAQFITEAGAMVASARQIGSSDIAAGEIAQGWLTDCADWFGLPSAINWERVVIEPGI